LRRDNFIKTAVPINVKVVRAFLQVHGEDQSHQSEIMISMQVADEDMIDAMKVRLNLHELHLRCFAAIDQKGSALYFYKLGRGMPTVCRQCTAGAQDGNFKTQPR
jgi:hypothetical protein